MHFIRSKINNIMRKCLRIEFRVFPGGDLKRRLIILKNYNINKIFDIGANKGQYAQKMRKLGFKGKIISFEPLTAAFDILSINSKKDRNWSIHKFALGDTIKESFINVAGNMDSSSILEMLPSHIKIAPNSKYIGREKITITTFDNIFENYYLTGDNILIKIDTQGFEKNIIDGAKKSLAKIALLQLELSLAPLYKGEILFFDMIDYLKEKGITLFSIENGFWNKKSGQLLQVDGIFINNTHLQN